jgi:DNA modification methylase
VRGDLWLLGRHRLLCGDATDSGDVRRLMGGALADMVFTDPPYGVGYTGGDKKEWAMLMSDDMSGDSLMAKLLLPAFRNMAESATGSAAFYVWHASSTRRDFEDAIAAAGLVEKQCIVWVKNSFQLGHADYQWAHEPCFYCEKAGQTAAFYGDRTNQTVWRASLAKKDGTEMALANGMAISDGHGNKIYVSAKPPGTRKTRFARLREGEHVLLSQGGKGGDAWEVSREAGIEHPTQKPVGLAATAIENSSEPGGSVLDLFGGSGTTLIAAEQAGRTAYLMELDPKYVDVAVRRFSRVAGAHMAKCVRGAAELSYSDVFAERGNGNG